MVRWIKKVSDDEKQTKLSRKDYEKELQKLQTELCLLQEWVKHKGLRVIVVFEGRDGAGKGGTIRAAYRTVEPASFSHGCLAGPFRSRKDSDVPTAIHPAFPSGR